MSLRRRVLTTTVATMSAALALGATAVAPASGDSGSDAARKLSSTVIAPFQVTLRGSSVYYTDGFAGTVSRVTPSGPKVVASVQGEIAGVAFQGRKMAFASTSQAGALLTIRQKGKKDVVANLGRYERTTNPDRKASYGMIANGNPCAAQALEELTGLPARYKGIKESHPYQVEALRGGAWAVADAAANVVLKVSKRGKVSTIARLPRQPVTFTQQQVTALGGPDCLVGVTYAFEPVPTDVERDRRGNLWVSTLPGGPEDPSLGARGAVYKITKSRAVKRVAGGFLGATNLAVAPGGRIYVAELFNNRISTLTKQGRVVTARTIQRPLSVEATKKHLYIGQMAKLGEMGPEGPGAVFQYRR